MMQKRSGDTHFVMKMDLSVHFYCFWLDKESKKYVTVITWDDLLYQYNRLFLGIKISPDEAQAIMEEVLQKLDVTWYIDNLKYAEC